MSQDDDEITKIEDLPQVDRSDEEESGFTSLEDMAQDLGIEESLPTDMPDLPNTSSDEEVSFSSDQESDFSSLDDEPDNDYLFESNDINDNNDFETNDFSENNYETNDFSDDNFSSEEQLEENTNPNISDSFLSDEDFSANSSDEQEVASNHEDFESDSEFDSYTIDGPSSIDSSDLLSAPDNDFEMADDQMANPFDDIDAKLDRIDDDIENQEDSNLPVATAPESFADVKEFAENIESEGAISPGNPPFSIILKEIKYQEDVQEILDILLDYKVISDEELSKASQNLMTGQYLIPRISEYLAIHLCHKFRKFDIEILVGLTEEIHPPKNYKSNDRGPVTKNTLYNNKTFHLKEFVRPQDNEVFTTTMNQISGHEIKQYLGIITHRKKMSVGELEDPKLEDTIYNNMSSENQDRMTSLRIKRENLLATHSHRIWDKDISRETKKTDDKAEDKLNRIYEHLVDEMKHQAINKSANAILGINFSITPISIDQYMHHGPQYEIICSGNLAWIEKSI